MSKRKKKPFKKAGAKPTEYSIARALDSFGPDEEMYLCAYLEASEKNRQGGMIDGWGLERQPKGYTLSVISEGQTIAIDAQTLKEGTKSLAQTLVSLGLSATASQAAPLPENVRLSKEQLPPKPEGRTDDDWEADCNAAFALSADVLKHINEVSIERKVGPSIAAAALTIALGRLSGRYAFRNMPREEVWKTCIDDQTGKPLFMLGFINERVTES